MTYEIEFSDEAKTDVLRIERSGDKKLLKKLHSLLLEL